jgi:ribonuclease Z
MKSLPAGIAATFALGIAVGAYLASSESSLLPSAVAQEAGNSKPMLSPVKARPRDVYYPNTEDLAPDEMRVIACGTGMPTTRAAQAAACFLVELGNGDKFIFDIGTGAAERISSLQIPYDYLDKGY